MTAAASATAAVHVRPRLAGRIAMVGHLGSTRDLELEYLIGHTDVLLQVGELERRAAPLALRRAQRANLERAPVHDNLKPVVIPLGQAGLQPESICVSAGPWRERYRE